MSFAVTLDVSSGPFSGDKLKEVIADNVRDLIENILQGGDCALEPWIDGIKEVHP